MSHLVNIEDAMSNLGQFDHLLKKRKIKAKPKPKTFDIDIDLDGDQRIINEKLLLMIQNLMKELAELKSNHDACDCRLTYMERSQESANKKIEEILDRE